MLERIREGSQSFGAKAVLVLIILTFALAGVGSYVTGGAESTVAEVNGAEITQTEYDRAYENERSRMQEQFGDMFDAISSDPGYMETVRRNVLNQLIEQQLLLQYARDNGMRISSAQVKQEIRDIPAFRTAGEFDNDTYLMALRNAGYTPESFANLMQDDLLRNQLLQALAGSEFVLDAEVLALLRLQQQTRSGGYLIANNQDYVDQVELSEADIENYYQSNTQAFQSPERIQVAYVELSQADLMSEVDITDADVREFYEQRQNQYRTEEERRVSHVLVEYSTENAEQKAQEALAKIEAGESFAEVAEQYSDDTFSAEAGGDLEWVEQGMMDEAFDDATFALENVGDTTGLVETSFGYHIIKLTDLRAGTVTPFDEVKDEVRQQLVEQQVEDRYFKLQQQLAEISFEQPDTLEPAAEAINEQVRRTDLFTRDRAPTPLSDDVILNNIFSDGLIDERLNSDVIETSDDRSLVVRVMEHQPQRTKDLAEVRSQIEQQLRTEKAQQLALEQAQQWQQQWSERQADAKLLDSVTMNNQEHPRGVVRNLFQMPPMASDEANLKAVELANGDAAVIALTKVTEGNAELGEQAQQVRNQLNNRQAQVLLQAFIDTLKEDAEIIRSN
ncbi:SurA N-terminal domain-containing protein [Idiomarina seosinensis]|uniref:Periplasmic chaperone PpiD n=1 Tax=Idiomarina seosinensis TaxID=281739 RepID=A0A432ZGS1_9GAMM|nr:SurA N-terminal domain-containing protein [Idiomarina seosinensis]RUO77176.1 peptidylprolyl isomerase [Idiomarina seosinensis]